MAFLSKLIPKKKPSAMAVYAKADTVVGRLLERLGEQDLCLLMSDNGFLGSRPLPEKRPHIEDVPGLLLAHLS
jgi:hypothetical protein